MYKDGYYDIGEEVFDKEEVVKEHTLQSHLPVDAFLESEGKQSLGIKKMGGGNKFNKLNRPFTAFTASKTRAESAQPKNQFKTVLRPKERTRLKPMESISKNNLSLDQK